MESEEQRIERLTNEREALRLQRAKLEIERLQRQIAMLRDQVAQVQTLRQAEAGVMQYLKTQNDPLTRT